MSNWILAPIVIGVAACKFAIWLKRKLFGYI